MIVTFDDALEYRLPFGLFAGKSLGELIKTKRGADYIGWLSTRKRMVPKETREALKMLLTGEHERRMVEKHKRKERTVYKEVENNARLTQYAYIRQKIHTRELREAAEEFAKEDTVKEDIKDL